MPAWISALSIWWSIRSCRSFLASSAFTTSSSFNALASFNPRLAFLANSVARSSSFSFVRPTSPTPVNIARFIKSNMATPPAGSNNFDP